jgi:cytochrome P450
MTLCTSDLLPTFSLYAELNANEPAFTLSSGVVIPPNVSIILHFEGVHTDPTFFKDPLTFDPLRWLESDKETMDKMNSHSFMFGYGSRICPGMHLAQHEGELALAYMAKHFDFELCCRPEEIVRIQAFTARPKYLPMKFIKRHGVSL